MIKSKNNLETSINVTEDEKIWSAQAQSYATKLSLILCNYLADGSRHNLGSKLTEKFYSKTYGAEEPELIMSLLKKIDAATLTSWKNDDAIDL